MSYIIGSGFFSKPNCGASWFYRLWWLNNLKYSNPDRTIVFAMGGTGLPCAPGEWINVNGDIGHVHDILNGIRPYPYCGNGIAVCVLALIAYLDEKDFIYKEQDLLAFGPWVEKMYEELGDGGIIIGRQKGQPCANSLVLIRHRYIIPFVAWYLSSPSENTPETISEHKFARWQESNPEVRFYSFGYDRDRPFNPDDPVWYAQKFTPEELLLLREKKLIDFEKVPMSIGRFSNTQTI